MRRLPLIHLVVFLTVLLLACPTVFADWPQNGVSLKETSGGADNVQSLPLDDGGAVLVWTDNGNSLDIIAQRIDGHGYTMWGPEGVLVSGEPGNQNLPVVLGDGSGGCVIAWSDDRNSNYDIYAQHLDPDGIPTWWPGGRVVCEGPSSQTSPSIALDGQGGFYFTWTESIMYGGDAVSVARMNSEGDLLWAGGKTEIVRMTEAAACSKIISDGLGGAIVSWCEDMAWTTSDYDIFAQRLNPDGAQLWYGAADFAIDSFFDIEYEIEFEGCPGSIIDGLAGNTTKQDTFFTHYGTGPEVSGSVNLPPAAGYMGELIIVDGLPPGTTLEGPAMIGGFGGISRIPGGSLGGEIITCSITIDWWVSGTGDLSSHSRILSIPGTMEFHTSPFAVIESLYLCDMELVELSAELFGDPDFCELRILGGTNQSYSGSGHSECLRQVRNPVCTQIGQQLWPEITTDGQWGAIIAWQDGRAQDYDLYAQHLNKDSYPYGAAGGVSVCPPALVYEELKMVGDGAGGAILAWMGSRLGYFGIYAQRINHLLQPQWGSEGVVVSNHSDLEWWPSLAQDGNGGALVAWSDDRNGNWDIYSQRLDASGLGVWPASGIPVGQASGRQRHPAICTDGEGGALVAWEDERSGSWDAYAQRVDRFGNWGFPAPEIVSIKDVPGDQGGLVDLAWDASRFDPWPDQTISEYSVWRSITENKAALAPSSDIRVETQGDKTIYWQLMETVAAMHLPGYSTTVPTLYDSLTAPPPPHFFQVMAHGVAAGELWASAPQTGYSVDNLAPATPLGLAGEGVYQPDGMQLQWNANAEPDIAHYVIHRGTSAGFVPDETNLVATTADTTALDDGWDQSSGWYYKVAAVDLHLNRSGFALLDPSEISGTGGSALPTVTSLLGNHPNPFNPGTVIRFELGTAEKVRLEIFDLSGRRIRTLLDGKMMGRGQHDETWRGKDEVGRSVAAGVYLYLLEAGSFSETKRMVLMK